MLPAVTRQQITWWGAGSILLVFAVSGVFGALVRADEPPQRWQVDAVSAAIVADRPPLQRSNQANRWLVVRAKVANIDQSSHTGLASIVRLSGVDGLLEPEPNVVLLRDETIIDRLHPGLPEEIAFAWEQTATAATPREITLELAGGSPITVPVTVS
jgi:hypothetical protein